MKWPWSRRKTSTDVAVAEPFAAFEYRESWPQRWPNATASPVDVSEDTALGLSGLYRAVSLIAGQLATLPLNSVRETGDGGSEPVPSVFDDPDGPDGQTPYEWKETGFLHLVIHGKAGALKVRNTAGGLVRLPWVHPLSFREEWPTAEDYAAGRIPAGGLWFHVQLADGQQVRLDANDFWYIPGLSLDGRTGTSLIEKARGSLGTALAGDRAAATMFDKGALISGLATPEDELEPEEMPDIRRAIDNATGGYENAGAIAVVNRRLKFTPWTMSAVDAQFLQQRQFQIEEIARWTGVPPHLLMQTEKQTSWGTGVEEQNRALGRTVLGPWATRFEQRGSRLLANPRRVVFDFAVIERPSPDREQEMTLALLAAKVITLDEARARLRLGPPPAELVDAQAAPDEEPADEGDDEGDDEDLADDEEDDDAPPAE